ncbi:MAG: TonB-dependent receptor domain-containing protein, partial [Terriglobia bacterium]
AFKTIGAHAIKFGVAFERDQLNMLGLSNPNGVFSFGTLAKFLTNVPSSFNAGFPDTLTPRGYRQTIFGTYVQDDWRYKPNLTLNMGLRYEISTVPTEVQGKLVNLEHMSDATPHLGSPLFSNPTYRNFEPRVGFAWDPFHNGKTSIRGGFGMFDVLPLTYLVALRDVLSAPFFKLGTIKNPGAGTFFAGAFPELGVGTLRMDYMQPAMKRAYTMQWNWSIQHQLTPSLTVMGAYVGSRGVHLPFTVDDGDVVLPTKTSAGYLWPSPVGSGTRVNENWGEVRFWLPQAYSSYNALEAQVTKRMSHGLQLQSSFTWGKSMDTNSASVAGDQFGSSIASLSWFDQSLTRGLSDFNVGRTLVVNAVWQVPSPKSISGPAHWLTNGWQLGGIFTAEDGIPFTPTFGTDGDPLGLNSGDTWDFPTRLTGPGCNQLVNPRNPNNFVKTQCFAVPTAPSLSYWTANCDPAFGTPTNLQCFNLRGNSGRNVVPSPGIA